MTHEKTDTATDDRMSGGGKEDGEKERRRIETTERTPSRGNRWIN